MTSAGTPGKRCYFFSPEESDADQSYKNLLGGKGANLAEMCDACLPPSPAAPASAFWLSRSAPLSLFARRVG
jgi:hypothetical protein